MKYRQESANIKGYITEEMNVSAVERPVCILFVCNETFVCESRADVGLCVGEAWPRLAVTS